MFHGFLQSSPNLFLVSPNNPNSGVFVLPKIMAFSFFTLSDTTLSNSGILSLKIKDPAVVLIPFVISISFIDVGIPCNKPDAVPSNISFSASFAFSRAKSKVCSKKAFS